MPLVLRSVKGSPLTNAEVDGNFTYLNDNKLSLDGNAATATSATTATNIAGGLIGYIPYQSAVNTTSLLAPGTAGYVLTTNGAGLAPTWTKGTAGATGAGNNYVFWENDKVITDSYTITASKNAGTFGPITINEDVTVTVPDGCIWTIV